MAGSEGRTEAGIVSLADAELLLVAGDCWDFFFFSTRAMGGVVGADVRGAGLESGEEEEILSIADAELLLVGIASGSLTFLFLTIFFFLTGLMGGVAVTGAVAGSGSGEVEMVSVAEAELLLVATASGCLAFLFFTIFFFSTGSIGGEVGDVVAGAEQVAGSEHDEEAGIVSVAEAELLLVVTATGCLAFFFLTILFFSTVELSVADGSTVDSNGGTGSAS